MPDIALLYHLAAVASARQGRSRQAERYWRKALTIHPNLDFAKDNLADAAKPIGERHGAWYYPLNYLGCAEPFAQLCALIDRVAPSKSDEALTRELKHFAEAHPEVVRLVPALLDRGDPVGREVAWRLAMLLETPEMLDALRGFCLSQRGPDALRLEAANGLCRLGTLPPGHIRMWIDGRWQDIELLGFQITTEPLPSTHVPQVVEWLHAAWQATRRGDNTEAEALFQRCIDLEGESPVLLNNLAASYGLQGRTDEAIELARQVHERWPDYFFGRIAMANIATRAGEYERAEEYLKPLRRKQPMHISEFSALAAASIQLLLDRGNVDGARSWLELWRDIDPEHPDFRKLESRCRRKNSLAALGSVFRRLRP